MNTPKISIIAAISENRALGKDNKLIFKISEDLKRFKQLTTGHAIIMGRKTFESIGRVLPNRTNIVITRNKDFSYPGVVVVSSLEEAIEEAKKVEKEEIFIIGGGQIFEQAMSITDRLYLTVVKGNYEADVFFPEYNDFSRTIKKEQVISQEFSYNYLILDK